LERGIEIKTTALCDVGRQWAGASLFPLLNILVGRRPRQEGGQIALINDWHD
tara:strand:- start:607 stop:762 length:156 start_codon:yes stop_codon:yes gene_type:complete